MAGFVKSYVKSVWRESSMHAFYPPETGAMVGDIYSFKSGAFTREKSLQDLGIDFELSHSSVGNWKSKASDGTSVETALNGKLPDGSLVASLADVEIGAVVKLVASSSYVADLSGVTKESIKYLDPVKHAIRGLFFSNQWKTSWILAVEVYHAQDSVIIGGSKSSTAVTLQAKADVGPQDAEQLELAGKFAVSNQASATMIVDGEKDLRPFFRGYRFRLIDILGVYAVEATIQEVVWDPTEAG
jgi:hypothetical protein